MTRNERTYQWLWRLVKAVFLFVPLAFKWLLRAVLKLGGMLERFRRLGKSIKLYYFRAKGAVPGIKRVFRGAFWRGLKQSIQSSWHTRRQENAPPSSVSATYPIFWLSFFTLTGLFIVVFSGGIATVPLSPTETWLARNLPEMLIARNHDTCRDHVLLPTCWFFDHPPPYLPKFLSFHRSLRVPGEVILSEATDEVRGRLLGTDAAVREEAVTLVRGIVLTNRDLRFADFRSVIMPRADLRGANLDFAIMDDGYLHSARLEPLDIRRGEECVEENQDVKERIKREGKSIEAVVKCITSINSASFLKANIKNGNLTRARLHGVRLWEANLQNAVLIETEFEQGASLLQANLQNAVAIGGRFKDADLLGAKLQGANLRKAQFQRASLGFTRLDGAILSEARLDGAELNSARLDGANLSQARLDGADLNSARLDGADLRGARLDGANLSQARFDLVDLRGVQLPATDGKRLPCRIRHWSHLPLSQRSDG